MNERRNRTDDEWLGAFADGELTAEEAAVIERRLAAEPALARRLEKLRRADESLRRAFAALDDAPLPDGVRELAARAPAAGGKVVPLRREPRSAARGPWLPVAAAASLALVAGFLLHGLIGRGAAPSGAAIGDTGLIADGSALERLLEGGRSGAPQSLASGGEGRIVLTFADDRGDWCRQFGARRETGRLDGVACRRAGDWRLETAVFSPARGPSAAYGQAADGTPAPLEESVRALMGGRAPLDPDAETLVISNNWEKPAE